MTEEYHVPYTEEYGVPYIDEYGIPYIEDYDEPYDEPFIEEYEEHCIGDIEPTPDDNFELIQDLADEVDKLHYILNSVYENSLYVCDEGHQDEDYNDEKGFSNDFQQQIKTCWLCNSPFHLMAFCPNKY